MHVANSVHVGVILDLHCRGALNIHIHSKFLFQLQVKDFIRSNVYESRMVPQCLISGVRTSQNLMLSGKDVTQSALSSK